MTLSLSLKKKLTAAVTFGLLVSSLGFFTPSAQARSFLTPDVLPNGRVGVGYLQSIHGSATLAYYWTQTGTLPPGTTGIVSTDGLTYSILGTPNTAGTFMFHLSTVRRDGGLGDSPTQDFSVVVDPMEIATAETLPNARVGSTYTQALSVLGGTPGYEWSIRDGMLPVGMTLNAGTGVISGTPLYALAHTFTVRAKDANGVNADKRFYLTVDAAPVTPVTSMVIYNDASLPAARVGTAYSVDLLASGGSTPYRWSVLVDTVLPPGLTLTTTGDSTGLLRGTPTTAGTYTFGVKLLEAGDASITKTFTVVIAARSVIIPPIGSITLPPVTPVTPAAVSISTTSVPAGTVGTSYTTTLNAAGGTAPYHWNFASGTLPPGLTLGTDGTISGRPTTAGSYTAYIEAFDASSTFIGRSFTFGIAAAPIISPTIPAIPTLPIGPIGTYTPAVPAASTDLTNRLNNLSAQGISINALVKLPDDGNRFTQADSAVYYIGADGRRHAFPNDRVFFTWYGNFDGVRVVSASALASVPLGANVTYKPTTKMVKFTTDPKVYAISNNRTLRWVKTEAAAQALYGSSWNRNIDDIADTFYLDYNFGADVNSASDYDRTGLQSSIRLVSDVLPL